MRESVTEYLISPIQIFKLTVKILVLVPGDKKMISHNLCSRSSETGKEIVIIAMMKTELQKYGNMEKEMS